MSDKHSQIYLRLIVEILPVTILKLDRTIDNREKYFGSLSDEEKDDFLGSSYFFLSSQLRATADALHTLSALSHVENDSLRVTVTQNGVAGLLREALEAIATYTWLNDYKTEEEARAKAHSYTVEDLVERLNYYEELGDETNITKTKQLQSEANQQGLDLGFTTQAISKSGVPFLKPMQALPSITDRIGKIPTPSEVVTTEVLKMYPGMKNARWLFRWASGLSHGKHWVTNFITAEDGSQRTVPYYLNLHLLLFTITQELERIFSQNEISE